MLASEMTLIRCDSQRPTLIRLSGWVRCAFLLALPLICLICEGWAENRVYIDIGKAQLKKSVLALPSLQDLTTKSDVTSVRVGQEIYEVLKNNLVVSGYFVLQNPDSFIEDPRKVGLKPASEAPNGFKFSNWNSIGTEFLVRAGYQLLGSKVRLQTFLYDIKSASLVIGKEYEGERSAIRKIAHTYANDMVQALTGKKGMFLSKVVVTRNTSKGVKEIFVMDWDGANARQITKNETISISPAWSPDGKRIAFTSFAYHPNWKSRNADLFMYDFANQKTYFVSAKRGTNSGAAFTPDGKSLYFSVTQAKTPTDIFRFDLATEKNTQVTRGPGQSMNVETSFSPDGSRMAFSSDRSGRPMIFVSDLNASSPKRVTFAGWYNSSPAWSPDGKKIAFAGQDKEKGGNFDIFMMDPDGQSLVRLTSAKKKNGKWSNNEEPSFSPDGRFVMFTSDRTMTKQIFLVDLASLEERQITRDEFNYERPRWSPFFEWNVEAQKPALVSLTDGKYSN